MRILTTAILGASALVLAVLIYLVDQKPEVGRQAASLANVLVRFEPNLIDRIVISVAGQETVMERRSGYWFFVSPEIDRVDPDSAAVLLDQLNHLSIIDRFTEEEASSSQELKEGGGLGFDEETAIRIEFSGPVKAGGKERHKQQITLGAASPRAKTLYAKSSGHEGEILVVDGNPRRFLESPLESIRDRRLLGAPVEGIVQILINSSKGELALQRRITEPRTAWALVRPLQTWANKDRLDQLLADLAGLQIEEVVKDSEGKFEIPNPLPDDAVVIQLRIFGMENPMSIFIREKKKTGKEGEQSGPPILEARVSDRPFTYLVRSNMLEKIPTSADDLRDRHLARIPIQNLDSITIQSRIDPLVFLKADRLANGLIRWDVNVGNKLVPANLGEIQRLVKGMNESAILDFVSDSPDKISEYGLDPPARRVIFKVFYPGEPTASGEPGPPKEVIRALKLGWKEGDEQRLYANFDGEPYIYELDPTFVGLIPTHPIKWRSLKVMTFNSFHLKKITKEMPGQSKVVLEYDYRRDIWTGTRNGKDISSSVDIGSVRKLRDRLGSLSAVGWYLSLAQAYSALEKPSAKFTIVTSELDPATNESREVTRVLELVSAAGELYFGRIEGSPDVFLIDKKTYGNLIRPVTSSRIQAP